MRFFDTISKKGMFCDKQFVHIFIKNLLEHKRKQCVSIADELNAQGEVKTVVGYFDQPIDVNISLYSDGIVRSILTVTNTHGEDIEVGRLLVDENTFIGTVKHLEKNKVGA